nr:alpha/beta-hydrolase family protein [Serinibacter arcticus]
MPIRVYAGLAGHDDGLGDVDLDEMAQEVVAELDRTDAWEREVVAVVTTTGTGWVDPLAVQALELVQDGDTAVAAMQYSVNPSWVTLVLDLDQPARAGQALFDAVQSRWAELPEGDRPQLVAFGVSLGSYGSQSAFPSLEDLTARADGAVWAGTPRFTPLWSDLTRARDAGSPEIHPVLDGGATARWGTANGGDQGYADLGPTDSPGWPTSSTRATASCGGGGPRPGTRTTGSTSGRVRTSCPGCAGGLGSPGCSSSRTCSWPDRTTCRWVTATTTARATSTRSRG